MIPPGARHTVARVASWILPLVIITVLLLKVDLTGVTRELGQANLALVVPALLLRPVAVLGGALRWWALLRMSGSFLPLGAAIRHYWVGMALGSFAPGQVGWDVYRAAVVRRASGRWGSGLAVVAAEKLLALATAAVMVLLLSGLVLPGLSRDAPALPRVVRAAQAILLVAAGTALGAAAARRVPRLAALGARMRDGLTRLARRLVRREGQGMPEPEAGFGPAFMGLLRPSPLLLTVGLSLALEAVGAASTHLLFGAVGDWVPYLVNLFMAPVLMFVLLLPVSLGGIGVREAAYIVLYAPFGVPAETALAVSVITFTGTLLSVAIGAVFIVGAGRPANRRPASCPG